MDPQNLAYALVQLVHNFGAVAVVGGTVAARWLVRDAPPKQHHLAWLVLGGWLAQAASGASFGAVSYHFYGQFPDIHAIARTALFVKLSCAAGGVVLAFRYLQRAGWLARDAAPTQRRLAWLVLGGWLAQAASGAGFGAVSYHFYGQFPDTRELVECERVEGDATSSGGLHLQVYGAESADEREVLDAILTQLRGTSATEVEQDVDVRFPGSLRE